MMTILAMTAILTGAALGLRFKVSILARAFVMGAAAAFAVGMAYGDSHWFVLLTVVLAVTALQMGYLGGIVIRHIIADDAHTQDLASAHRGLTTARSLNTP